MILIATFWTVLVILLNAAASILGAAMAVIVFSWLLACLLLALFNAVPHW